MGSTYTSWIIDHDILSGLPAGTPLDKVPAHGSYPDSGDRFEIRLENRDAALFTIGYSAVTNLDTDSDGEFDEIEYDIIVTLARPTIAGEYGFDLQEVYPYFKRCNFVTTDTWTVTVTSPEGTLHEFFFDPVTVGSTVAADSTTGVLSPVSFTGVNGATTTISSLAWEPSSTSSEAVAGSNGGQVKLEFTTASDPADVLGDHMLDFIEPDGSVSLSLEVFDATVGPEPASNTLSWAVSSQPWESGDKLMARIRRAPLSCRSSEVIPDARNNAGLVSDCEALMGARDPLAGSLNWGFTIPITDWDGVTIDDRPRRVTRLELHGESLTGEIPPELGSLSGLQTMDLSGNRLPGGIPSELGGLSELQWIFLYENRLSGEIPPELGGLTGLRRLYLQDNGLTGGIPPELGSLTSLFHLWLYGNRLGGTIPWELVNLTGLELLLLGGNGFVGCVPQGLRDIALNDFDGLGLADCAEGLVGAPTDLEVSIAGGGFSLTWTAVTGAGLYEAQYAEGDRGDWEVIGTTTATSTVFSPGGGPACDTTFRFSVRAYGDAQTHAAGWGPESGVETVTTGACNRAPEFATSTYSFTIAEDAATSTVVGTVSAIDPDEDMPGYRITSGNPDGSFAVRASTGEIIVAGTLDHETAPSHSLTVEADDGRGGTATATVRIAVTDVAEDAPPRPTGLSASLIDREFSLSWNTVMGATTYEVQYRNNPTDGWTAIASTTDTHLTLSTDDGPVCGTTYRFRVRAYGDGETYAAAWGVESGEAPVTTGACNRAPEFSTSTYSFMVSENVATSTAVGRVSAMDPDDDMLTYSITGSDGNDVFSLERSTGEIKVSGALDHERRESYVLTVEAGDDRGGTATATVLIAVTDVAEDAPPAPADLRVSLQGGEFSIEWDAMTGVDHYEVQLDTGVPGDEWEVIGTTAIATLDFSPDGGPACGKTYRFRVRAYGDGDTYAVGWGLESGEEAVTTEACNRAPEFATSTYSFTIAEDAATSTVVGTVSATDPEGDDVYYNIIGGNGDGRFEISMDRGTLVLLQALDYEGTASYTLTVEASDRNETAVGTDTATVEVSVTDVPEEPPPVPTGLVVSLEDDEFSLGWHVVPGAGLYEAHYSQDSEADRSSLGTTTTTTLSFSPTGGVVCGATYYFTVRAYGDGDTYLAAWGTESGTESVSTAACNRPPGFATSTHSFTVAEDAATSTSIGTVSATDPDDDTLTYRIAAGNDVSLFDIGESSGEITVAGALDNETTAFHVLTVVAHDGRGGTAAATVDISLILPECSNGTVVPRPADNPRLVRDCSPGGTPWRVTEA